MGGVWKWYTNFTSIGGFTQFLASNNKFSKLFWLILTLTGLVLTIVGISQTIYDFFLYDVTTSVTIGSNDTLYFPTVTICNANRVHCGQLLTKINNCVNVSTFLHT